MEAVECLVYNYRWGYLVVGVQCFMLGLFMAWIGECVMDRLRAEFKADVLNHLRKDRIGAQAKPTEDTHDHH